MLKRNINILGLLTLCFILVGCHGDPFAGGRAPSTAATLSLSFAQTKAFHFTWTDVAGADFYKLKEAKTTSSGYSVVNDNMLAVGGANSVDHIVPLFGRLNAKYILQSCNAAGCTDSAEVFTSTRLAQMGDSIGYLKASNTTAGDTFGTSVSISGDGNTLAIGTIIEDSGAGAVYVFTRSGKNWSQQAYIQASNTAATDKFGSSVSLSTDGNTLAVGAIGEDSDGSTDSDNSVSGAGAVYIYTRVAASWSQQAYLKASNAGYLDVFGRVVSLNTDGNTLVVGASGERSDGTSQGDDSADKAGAVYVFIRTGVSWAQQAYIKASNAQTNDGFGMDVSVSADGDTLAVGAYMEASIATGVGGDDANNDANGAGAVYVYTRSSATWSQTAYIKASNTASFDLFGFNLSLSADGQTLAVGAWGEDSNSTTINGLETDNSALGAGAVYVFTLSGSTWAQQAYVKASNAEAADAFGLSVSLSSDGNTLAVGASIEKGDASGFNGAPSNNAATAAGAAYVLKRSGGVWSQQSYLKASNAGAGDKFGTVVALDANGDTLAVAAPYEASNAVGVNGDQANNAATDAGAVYVY